MVPFDIERARARIQEACERQQAVRPTVTIVVAAMLDDIDALRLRYRRWTVVKKILVEVDLIPPDTAESTLSNLFFRARRARHDAEAESIPAEVRPAIRSGRPVLPPDKEPARQMPRAAQSAAMPPREIRVAERGGATNDSGPGTSSAASLTGPQSAQMVSLQPAVSARRPPSTPAGTNSAARQTTPRAGEGERARVPVSAQVGRTPSEMTGPRPGPVTPLNRKPAPGGVVSRDVVTATQSETRQSPKPAPTDAARPRQSVSASDPTAGDSKDSSLSGHTANREIVLPQPDPPRRSWLRALISRLRSSPEN